MRWFYSIPKLIFQPCNCFKMVIVPTQLVYPLVGNCCFSPPLCVFVPIFQNFIQQCRLLGNQGDDRGHARHTMQEQATLCGCFWCTRVLYSVVVIWVHFNPFRTKEMATPFDHCCQEIELRQADRQIVIATYVEEFFYYVQNAWFCTCMQDRVVKRGQYVLP